MKAMADIITKYLFQNTFLTEYLRSSGTRTHVAASFTVKCKIRFTFMIKPRIYTPRKKWNHWFGLDIKLNILTKIVVKS